LAEANDGAAGTELAQGKETTSFSWKGESMSKLFSLLTLAAFALTLALSTPANAKALEGVVNINTATTAELTLLPGVGKAKAEQIVQYRQAKPFTSVDDLKNIPGLGQKRIEAMRSHVTLQGPTTAKRLSAKPASGANTAAPASAPKS
jgi:competence ComEA-like helix-hairpin-helix protein